MSGFLLRVVLNTTIIIALIFKIPGIIIATFGGTLLGSTIIGIINALIRPGLIYKYKQINNKKLIYLTLIINLIIPSLVFKVLPGVKIYSLWTSLLDMLLLTISSILISKYIGDR